MKQTRALEEQWETYGVEIETIGMVMLNFKHRSKSAYFAEQKRLRLRERRRGGGGGGVLGRESVRKKETGMQTGNMFKRKSVLTVQEDRITREEKKLWMNWGWAWEREDIKIALQIKESLTKVTVYPDTIWWEREWDGEI